MKKVIASWANNAVTPRPNWGVMMLVKLMLSLVLMLVILVLVLFVYVILVFTCPSESL